MESAIKHEKKGPQNKSLVQLQPTNALKLKGTSFEGNFLARFGEVTCSCSDLRPDKMTFVPHPFGEKGNPQEKHFLAHLLRSLPCIYIPNCVQHCLTKGCHMTPESVNPNLIVGATYTRASSNIWARDQEGLPASASCRASAVACCVNPSLSPFT